MELYRINKITTHWLSPGGEGAEVVYALRNKDTLAQAVLDEIGAAGQKKRKVYQKRLPEDPSKDYYFIQRLTGKTEPILVEYGFIDNKADANKLRNNLEDYVEGTVKAITNYAGYTYTPPNTSITGEYYTVQKGDSLWSIANKFNTTVENLRKLNNLTSDILQIGQKLLIKESSNPEDVTTYIVQKGDSLWSIANKFNTTVENLRKLNNLTSDILQVGQILIIKETEIPPSTNTTTYIVQKGDSLWSIANKFNTTVENLRNLNRLTSDTLQIGQELIVPNENNEEKPETTISYTVKKGDSLWKIANEYNVSVNDIINLNNLTSNILQVGQVLLIPVTTTRPPEPPIMETTYTVQRGDSLWSIANKFNTTVEKLRAVNNLTTDILQIGQILTIPSPNDTYISETEIEEYNPITNTQEGDITVVDEEAPVPELTSPLLTEQPSELQDYTTILPTNNNQIKKEETENLNNLLNTEVLQEEPTREEKEEEYHVKRGDSLWLIAKKYNTTVTNLINYNELQSINLKINDILKVPTTIQSRNYYTVQNGDTLWSIASSHNLSFQELKKINNLKDNSVTIGQKLIVNEKE